MATVEFDLLKYPAVSTVNGTFRLTLEPPLDKQPYYRKKTKQFQPGRTVVTKDEQNPYDLMLYIYLSKADGGITLADGRTLFTDTGKPLKWFVYNAFERSGNRDSFAVRCAEPGSKKLSRLVDNFSEEAEELDGILLNSYLKTVGSGGEDVDLVIKSHEKTWEHFRKVRQLEALRKEILAEKKQTDAELDEEYSVLYPHRSKKGPYIRDSQFDTNIYYEREWLRY